MKVVKSKTFCPNCYVVEIESELEAMLFDFFEDYVNRSSVLLNNLKENENLCLELLLSQK